MYLFYLFLGLASLTSLNGLSRLLARQGATPRHREQVNNVVYSAAIKGTVAGNVFSKIPLMRGYNLGFQGLFYLENFMK